MSDTRYKKPKTIDELRWFCDDHNIPAREMRFFIGEDFKEPKAFGIYRDDDGDFVVYKNKADGSRAVRYKGPDEAFAVNEIYEKMKSEVEQRKQAKRSADPGSRSSGLRYNGIRDIDPPRSYSGGSSFRFSKSEKTVLAVILALVIAGCGYIGYKAYKFIDLYRHTPNSGYYAFHGTKYYDDAGTWYYYDDSYDDWYPADYVDPLLIDDYGDYYISGDYSEDYFDEYGITDFRDSEYYYSGSYYDSDDDYYYDDDDDDWSWDDYDWDDDDDWDWDYDYDYDDSDWDSDW
jgi:hypothetical protein